MHFPDLEVCCDGSTFFPLKSADVSEAGTCDAPLRTPARKASVHPKFQRKSRLVKNLVIVLTDISGNSFYLYNKNTK